MSDWCVDNIDGIYFLRIFKDLLAKVVAAGEPSDWGVHYRETAGRAKRELGGWKRSI